MKIGEIQVMEAIHHNECVLHAGTYEVHIDRFLDVGDAWLIKVDIQIPQADGTNEPLSMHDGAV
jgi:hypothetical protein